MKMTNPVIGTISRAMPPSQHIFSVSCPHFTQRCFHCTPIDSAGELIWVTAEPTRSTKHARRTTHASTVMVPGELPAKTPAIQERERSIICSQLLKNLQCFGLDSRLAVCSLFELNKTRKEKAKCIVNVSLPVVRWTRIRQQRKNSVSTKERTPHKREEDANRCRK